MKYGKIPRDYFVQFRWEKNMKKKSKGEFWKAIYISLMKKMS